MWAMRLCVARSSKKGPSKSVANKKKKIFEMYPRTTVHTNPYNSRVRIKNKKQAMTPTSEIPEYEILQPCLTARISGYVII